MRQEYIRIDCPEDNVDLRCFFRSPSVTEKLKRAMDLDVSHCSERAHVYDVEIDAVEEDEEGDISITYRVHWDAYYGCSDQSSAGTEDGELVGEFDEDGWLFRVHSSPQPRSTFDEL